jgi:RNA polymerase sigma factor (sigma-70 family)
MNQPPPTDRELLQLFVSHRSEESFAKLVQRYLPLVRGVAQRRLHDRGLIDDVAQAVFWLLASRAPSLLDEPTVGPWLHRAAVYASNNANRTRTRRRIYELRKAQMSTPSAHRTPPADERLAALDDALNRLSKADRTILLARYATGTTMAEASASLGLSMEAGKKRFHRALKRLRGLLQGDHSLVDEIALGALLVGAGMPGESASLASETSKTSEQFARRVLEQTDPVVIELTQGAVNMMRYQLYAKLGAAAVVVLGGLTAAGLALKSSPTETARPGAGGNSVAMVFGEVRNIVVKDDSAPDDDCIDLDTGKTTTNHLRAQTREEGQKWWIESGADAHCETTSPAEECGLWGMGVAWVARPESDFDSITPLDADRLLSSVETEFDNLALAEPGKRSTYLFKTKDGGMGMIQFVAMQGEGSDASLTLRWKRLLPQP